jgi:hypothetical protein
MNHPKISVVLRVETEVAHDALADAISEKIYRDYTAFCEKSDVYRSQFQLWEGGFRELPQKAVFLSKVIGYVARLIAEFGVVTCLLEAEIAVFTHSDNQQVIVPQPFLEACVRANVRVAAFFFRCR